MYSGDSRSICHKPSMASRYAEFLLPISCWGYYPFSAHFAKVISTLPSFPLHQVVNLQVCFSSSSPPCFRQLRMYSLLLRVVDSVCIQQAHIM